MSAINAAKMCVNAIRKTPNIDGFVKKSYFAQRRRARREKNLSASASPRDKEYDGQEFLIGAYSGENAVKIFRSRHAYDR